MANNQQIRSFIAIELPEGVKAALVGLQTKLRLPEHNFVKWVAPEGVHLTLKFLGNVASNKISEIVGAMNKATQGISPFRVEFHGLGAFPNLRQPRVLWVGVGGETDRLIDLQRRVDAALTPLGFTPESRSFSPHLTLARLREGASSRERQDFGELVQKTRFEAKHFVGVEAISLMRSQLMPAGAVYTCLAEVRLRS